jgi:demethylmenaquinone methyltransferase/2-methoxy-6-polyprenyl-1,4-benzoquinol methylase
MNIESSMVSYYAGRAREYERIYHKPERQDDLQRLRDFVAATFAGAHVFEVACGTGYWTDVLARTAGSVVATDINEEVLAVARSKSIEAGKVEFRREDAYALPVLPRRFDGGLACFWWSHVPRARVQSFLAGFHRVLAPNARVVFMDNVYVEGSSTPISRTDERGDTYQMRLLDDGSKHEVLKNFPSESALRAAVEGLATDVQVKFLEYYWILSYRRL